MVLGSKLQRVSLPPPALCSSLESGNPSVCHSWNDLLCLPNALLASA